MWRRAVRHHSRHAGNGVRRCRRPKSGGGRIRGSVAAGRFRPSEGGDHAALVLVVDEVVDGGLVIGLDELQLLRILDHVVGRGQQADAVAKLDDAVGGHGERTASSAGHSPRIH